MSGVIIMRTDNGPHPPEKIAYVTACLLLPIDDNMPGDRLFVAHEHRLAAAKALTKHHDKVQKHERSQLAKLGDDHLEHEIKGDFGLTEHMDDATADFINVMKKSPWKDRFAKPEVQAAARDTIARMMRSTALEERQWHCDLNPTPRAKAFKAALHPVMPDEDAGEEE